MCEEAAPQEILNAEHDFIRLAPVHIRSQFLGMPVKLLLSEGETLFRFFERGFNGPPSDFWIPLETYHHLRCAPGVPGWAVWKNVNSRADVAPAMFCRATLVRKVFGFKGCVRSTHLQAITQENLLTGSMIWIPGLKADDFFLRSYWLGEPGPPPAAFA